MSRYEDYWRLMYHIPPERQGQTVEVAYAVTGVGGLYRRTIDRSLGPDDAMRCRYEVAWWDDVVSSAGWCQSCAEPWNREPSIPDDLWHELTDKEAEGGAE